MTILAILSLAAIQTPITSSELAGGSMERDDGSLVLDILAPASCTPDVDGEIVVCGDEKTAKAMDQPSENESKIPQARLRLGENTTIDLVGESADLQGARSQRAMAKLKVGF